MAGKNNPNIPAVIFALLTFSSVATSGHAAEPIKQTFVGYVSYNRYVQPRWKPIRVGNVTIAISDVENEIVVSARDKQARPWNVYVKTAGGTGASMAWTADLDSDGAKDLIFVRQNTYNGRCVSRNQLTIILFDGEGRPSPWEVEGYFNWDYSWQKKSGRGVLDLGDWNKNGRAELVQTNCFGYEYQGLPYEPYSLVDVFEADKGVWRRLSNAERSRHESTYREVARSEFRKLLPDAEEKKFLKENGTFVPDYSNDRARGMNGKIATFMPTLQGDDRRKANCGVLRDFDEVNGQLILKSQEEKKKTRERCDEHLILENGTVCFTSYRDSTLGIVLTRADATEAVMNWESERAQSLLKHIIAEKLPVTLTGQLEEGVCSPTLIRASKP